MWNITKRKKRLSLLRLLAALLASAGCAGPLENSENLVLAHDEKFFTVDLDFRSTVFSEEHPIAFFHIEWLAGAVLLVFAFSSGHDLALLGLLFRCVGNDDSPSYLLAFLNSPQYHAVMKRPNIGC